MYWIGRETVETATGGSTLARADATFAPRIPFGVAMAGTLGRLTEDCCPEVGAVQAGTSRGHPFDSAGFVIDTRGSSTLARSTINFARNAIG